MDRFNFSGIWISLQLWSDRQNFEGFPVYFLWAECLLLTAAPSLCPLSGAPTLPFQQWSPARPINSEHSNGKQSLMNMSVISLNQGCIPLGRHRGHHALLGKLHRWGQKLWVVGQSISVSRFQFAIGLSEVWQLQICPCYANGTHSTCPGCTIRASF